jgi:hypothetical protein
VVAAILYGALGFRDFDIHSPASVIGGIFGALIGAAIGFAGVTVGRRR